MNDFKTTELDRRSSNLIRLGAIEEADYLNAKVKVRVGDLVTAWLPWLTQRAGGNVSWHAPEVGEQVMILSPSGELNQGVVLMAIYQNSAPPNANNPDIHRMDYGNGDFFEYDRAGGNLNIHISGNLTISAGGTVTVMAQQINLN
jgi:phage baseplate assembly protein V